MNTRPRRGKNQKARVSIAERRALRAEITDPNVLMEAAAAFLAVRPRSVAETRRRLLHLGYQAPLVETVLVRLADLLYLDDEAFARAWVGSRDRARPRGETALRRELALKGVDRETVRAVLAERDVTESLPDRAAAERLLARRGAALRRETDPQKQRQKAYALLARNGFDPEICRSAAAAFANPSSDDAGDDSA